MTTTAAESLPKPLSESEKDLLPKAKFWGKGMYQWQGFWFIEEHLDAAIKMRSHLEARDDDVFLASSMKVGTTWLKALLTCIMQIQVNDVNKGEDPLTKNPPAAYVQTLEVQVYTSKQLPDLAAKESPRIFHTHVPYSLIPDSVKNSDGKIVYVTRNPKDTLVSMWHFGNNFRSEPCSFEEEFESFCEGICPFGPFFDHALEYWNESLRRPHKILILKYEDLKRDTKAEVKKIASFLGRPFASEEEAEDVVRRCSLDRLKNMEVNIPKKAYFRNGIVGDWKNHFTPEMANRLDEITRKKLEGSGFDLEI